MQAVDGRANALTLTATSLSGDGPLPKGHYYLITDSRFTPNLLFSVVDTTLITKLSVDEFLVWALDYDTGAPLSGVPVQLDPARNGIVARTGPDGLASFAVPPPNRFSDQERAHTAKVDANGRLGIVSSRWSRGTEPYQLGLPIDFYPRDFVGHLFTDRPIYRPGETVFYKGTLRLDDDARYSVPQDTSVLHFIIRDPHFNELTRLDVTVNEFGTFAGEFILPPGADTGRYSLSLERRDRFTVTSAQFRIAEFRTPEFEVTVTPATETVVDGDQIVADAEAIFFFGGPLADAAVTWAMFGSPTAIRVEGFESYSFRDFDFFRRSELQQPLRAEGETVTNAAGVARISARAALAALEGTQHVTISVTVSDQNDQVVASTGSVTVHPADYYAGIRATTYIARVDETATIDLVTVNTEGQPLAQRAVTVEIFERQWVTTKELGPQGRFYHSEPVDTLINTIQVTTDANAVARVAFLPAKPGQLRLVATVVDGRGRVARSSAFLWVSGSGRASWRIRNDDVIELVADKDLYDVGDIAEILVPSPFEGAIGLVTVERGKIISRSVEQFETTSETLRIRITDGHVPNIFVSVVLYRPPTAVDPIPRYHVGYVELPISTASRLLTVTIKPDREQTRPGETVRYDIHVQDRNGVGRSAEVSVAIVDKAVLSLAAEVGPNGLRAFWFQRGLGVRTAASVGVSVDRINDAVIQAIQDGTKGGGGDDPDIRGDFRNTAYWAAQVVTDDNGNASVNVPMPDNLTTWRAQARAVSGDTLVGEGVSELLSTQPLLIRSALPRFFRVGDSATLRMLVRNATDTAREVAVSLEATGITITGPLTQTKTVPAGDSVTYAWPALLSQAGTAVLTFTARGGNGLADAIRLERPVYLDVTPETTATGGVVTTTSALEAVYLPPYAILDQGSLQVSVQASLVGALDADLSAFRPLPFESVVRVANRVIATLGARRADGDASSAVRSSQIAADVTRLIDEQRLDGGWSWCGTCRTNLIVTAWVLLALGDARDAGRHIDASVIGRATELVRAEINRATDVANPADPNRQAFLLYAAASAGGAPLHGAMRAIVQQNRNQLANWGRSYLILGLQEGRGDAPSGEVRTLINDLTAAVIPSANGNHWEDLFLRGSMHNGSTRVTALALRALTTADPDHPLIEETARWLVTARDAQRYATLVERAQAIASLGDFANRTGERRGDYDYAVTLDGASLLTGHFQPSRGANVAAEFVPLGDLRPGDVSLISFEREASAPGRLYYGLNLRYVTPAREVEALNRGFAVSHEYTLLDDPDRRINSATLGDVVRVRVTIMADADRKCVTVDDFLPAGLEPIDPQLDIVPIELRQQLQQERQAAVAANAPEYVAPWYRYYFNPWDQVNVRDDRVTLRAENLPRGVYVYVYFARATSPGDYFVAPAHAEETFFPELFGRSDSGRFAVLEPGE